jgi:hypothetical protein
MKFREFVCVNESQSPSPVETLIVIFEEEHPTQILQIPDARIMTFGHNADAAFGQSTAEVVDHAKSLLASLVDKREEQEVQNRTGNLL